MIAQISRLRAEHRTNAFGLGTATPRLSWWVAADGGVQAWAEIERTTARGPIVARIDGDEQVLVTWPFEPLRSRERSEVRVRVGINVGEGREQQVSAWSSALVVEAGLLERDDWASSLIIPSETADHSRCRPAWMLRAEFDLATAPVRARLYVTAQGLYRTEINGRRVGDDELAPGWTSYGHRLRAQAYDVTETVVLGSNAIGFEIADGWFRGHIGFDGGVWDLYGANVGVLAQLEVTADDGTIRRIDLDKKWRTAVGGTIATGLYEGESFDARLHPEGWSTAGFDDSGWMHPLVRPVESIDARIEHAIAEPVRQIERLAPVMVERLPSGRVRLDFGQNISGRLEMTVRGASGHRIRLHHAEVLEGGELGIRALRAATSVDEYVIGGGEVRTWQPRFTIHGFRFAEIENWPDGLDASALVRAVVLHTDMERTGWFECSDPNLTKLHDNTVWSMRDNFVDLPTDCPQRDERMGWTGDIQVFAPAATYLYGSGGVLSSWLRDLADEQHEDGAVPNFVPWVPCGFPEPASPAWGDAAAVVPWAMWQRFGDRGILAQQFSSMRAWVEHLASRADEDGAIRSGFSLGDWLDPAAPPEDPGAGRTDRYLVATAYLVRSSRIVAEAAELLGEHALRSRYHALADHTLRGFQDEHIARTGRMHVETPTGLSLAIAWNLFATEGQRETGGRRLSELVAEGDYRISTGFVGTPIICDALVQTGHIDSAYRLLLERECPSWLYPVSMGATTIWERWDSMLPDGRVNPGDMTSFNHYALGAVVDFLHRIVAGLAPRESGYRSFNVAPQPGPGIDCASTEHLSPYGPIRVAWQRDGDGLNVDVEVPFGTTAYIQMPGDDSPHIATSGRHRFSAAPSQPKGQICLLT
ncbi:alpha-L-rhamnosidase [Microbacterium halimionae]|uniref:alpha-L-rhamnosidase n=1 Tax=Microbacterium halimionae TaxID=1526413 RepID=A0A7W3JQJ2_9MICO|nr:alpha-L-rhamnosidase [Microbacterium halimionae]MBA8817179.1 alpha-L-rhamnosidase [Microbacterium halimionae]NII94629.1 alpha-L-rhamnosidase [Microbacterium halimionae]